MEDTSGYARWLGAERARQRARILAELKWLRAAVDAIERSVDHDFRHADSEARNAAQHLVAIAAAAAALHALNESAAVEEAAR